MGEKGILGQRQRIMDTLKNNGEVQTDVGDARPIYQQYWERLRTGI